MPARLPKAPILVDMREFHTIIAALRSYQDDMEQGNVSPVIADLADNGATVEPLTADEIDSLVERINLRP